MNMPAVPLPTDNLYKFLALSGVALVALSFIYPIRRLGELEAKTIETEVQVSTLEIEVRDITADIDAAERGHPDTDEVKTLRKRNSASEVKSAELRGRAKLLNALQHDLEWTRRVLLALGVVGLFLSTLGFLLWYFRIQRPADVLAARGLNAKGA